MKQWNFRKIGWRAAVAGTSFALCFSQSQAASTYHYQGTLVINLTATVESAIPAGTKVICDGSIKVGTFEDDAETYANISNGQAACTLTIPYSWQLSSPNNTFAPFSYSLQTADTESSGTNNRYASSIITVNFPAAVTTITKDINVTL